MHYLFKKQLLLLISMTLLASSVVLTACYKNYWVYANPDSLYFSSDDETPKYVDVIVDGGWFISQVDPFISVDPKSGKAKGFTVRMAESNPDIYSRVGHIVVSSLEEPNNTAIITVHQDGRNKYDY